MDQGPDEHRGNRPTPRRTDGDGGRHRGTAKRKPPSDTTSTSDAIHRATGEIKGVAGTLTSLAGDELRRFADRQVGTGADMVGQVAQSVRLAADNLDESLPQLAGLVREVADRGEELAETVRGQSTSDLAEMAVDFARRRPAVLLGAAAAAGFVFYRLLTAAPVSEDDEEEWADSEQDEAFGGGATGMPRSARGIPGGA